MNMVLRFMIILILKIKVIKDWFTLEINLQKSEVSVNYAQILYYLEVLALVSVLMKQIMYGVF